MLIYVFIDSLHKLTYLVLKHLYFSLYTQSW